MYCLGTYLCILSLMMETMASSKCILYGDDGVDVFGCVRLVMVWNSNGDFLRLCSYNIQFVFYGVFHTILRSYLRVNIK